MYVSEASLPTKIHPQKPPIQLQFVFKTIIESSETARILLWSREDLSLSLAKKRVLAPKGNGEKTEWFLAGDMCQRGEEPLRGIGWSP